MKLARKAKSENLSIRPVVAPRPIGILLGLNGSQNPFSGTPTYKEIAHLGLKERLNIMKADDIRKKISGLARSPFMGTLSPHSVS